MNRFLMSAVGVGLAILSACATTNSAGVTRTTSGTAQARCLDETAACTSDADCCNANCFYGVCERPEQE